MNEPAAKWTPQGFRWEPDGLTLRNRFDRIVAYYGPPMRFVPEPVDDALKRLAGSWAS